MTAYKRLQMSSQNVMYVSSLNCMWENRARPSILSDCVFVLREVQRKLPSPKPKLLSPTVNLKALLDVVCSNPPKHPKQGPLNSHILNGIQENSIAAVRDKVFFSIDQNAKLPLALTQSICPPICVAHS